MWDFLPQISLDEFMPTTKICSRRSFFFCLVVVVVVVVVVVGGMIVLGVDLS